MGRTRTAMYCVFCTMVILLVGTVVWQLFYEIAQIPPQNTGRR
jgi:hypothetical protein